MPVFINPEAERLAVPVSTASFASTLSSAAGAPTGGFVVDVHPHGRFDQPLPEGCDDLLDDGFEHLATADAAADVGLYDVAMREADRASEALSAYCSRCQTHRSYAEICGLPGAVA